MKKHFIYFICLSFLYTTSFAQEVIEYKPQNPKQTQTSDDHHDDDHHDEVEVMHGHVHSQANIQIVQTKDTFLFEMDMPAGDLKEKTQKNISSLRMPDKIFHTTLNDTCHLTQSSYQEKALKGGHADIMIRFEYHCKKPISLDHIDLNPLFSLPINTETAVTHIIIGQQVLPPVKIKKKNALLKIKKSSK